MLPVGIPSCTSVLAKALKAFVVLVGEYVFATAGRLSIYRSAIPCRVTRWPMIALDGHGVEACCNGTADRFRSAEPWLHRDLELHRRTARLRGAQGDRQDPSQPGSSVRQCHISEPLRSHQPQRLVDSRRA